MCVCELAVCLTLCDRMDYSQPGSSVYGILLARILEWVAIPFSRGHSDPATEPRSPVLPADSSLSEPPGNPTFTYIHSFLDSFTTYVITEY